MAKYLKDNITEITPPPWAPFVKTGAHTERPPTDPDWWYVRCASLLRKVYLRGPIGISRLSKEYGGRIERSTRPEHFCRGGRSILRKALQQLEAAKLMRTEERRGRVLTEEGWGLADRLAGEIKRELERSEPELKKY